MKLFSGSDDWSEPPKEPALSGMYVYIVEHGSYSDRRIVGVFEHEEDAAAYCSKFDECDYEAFEINKDARFARSEENYYKVAMYFDGHVLSVEKSNPFDWAWDGFHKPTRPEDGDRRPDAFRFKTICLAKNEDHAIKIAADRRIQKIHNGELNDVVRWEKEKKEQDLKNLDNQKKMDEYKKVFNTIMDLGDSDAQVDIVSILKKISSKDKS